MAQQSYKSDFFIMHLDNSLSSAKEVIPVVLPYIQPRSVIDVGCGIGTWLTVWQQNGVSNILGVDGPYVKKEQLLIDQAFFVSHDLATEFKSIVKYDLVSSLEVGEHINPPSAETFIRTLCGLGDIILFSAAIPGQGGTYHFNEQYPDYWTALFAKQGFVPVDCIRKQVWENKNISWWYRQNVLFFVRKEALPAHEKLSKEYAAADGKVMRLVHPELLDMRTKEISYYKKNLRNPVRLAGYYVKKLIGK